MFRIDGPGATNDNKFTEGDPANGTRATVVTAEWLTALQEEIASAIESENEVLNKNDNNQLSKIFGRRVSYFETLTALKQKNLKEGSLVVLTQEFRNGVFVIKAGVPPSDPEEGIFILLANGNYAERINFLYATPNMFGGRNSTAIQAAFDSGFPVDLGSYRDYSLTSGVTLNNGQVTNGYESKRTLFII